ncbi:hypothetical protein HQ571_00565 [Candidatus Kuenenbacteria bacterium]|nr:hypothetical protein [Candidatus Kuenenbacteria bacterium]
MNNQLVPKQIGKVLDQESCAPYFGKIFYKLTVLLKLGENGQAGRITQTIYAQESVMFNGQTSGFLILIQKTNGSYDHKKPGVVITEYTVFAIDNKAIEAEFGLDW